MASKKSTLNAKKLIRANGRNGAKAPAKAVPFKLTYSTMFNPPELMT